MLHPVRLTQSSIMISTPKVPISFEFFPPRNDEQKLILESTWQKLSRLKPRHLSVTFGAGGSTLEATLQTVTDMLERSGVPVAPHISCMARDRNMLLRLLESYKEAGVERLVVLRGDRPEGVSGPGPFQYASELVGFVQESFPDVFHIEVACYPEFHPESTSTQFTFHVVIPTASASSALCWLRFGRNPYEKPTKSAS